MTPLQRKLYILIENEINPHEFKENYNNAMAALPANTRKYYSMWFSFTQMHFNGGPKALPVKLLILAGYKNPSSDRAYGCYFKVLKKVYMDLVA